MAPSRQVARLAGQALACPCQLTGQGLLIIMIIIIIIITITITTIAPAITKAITIAITISIINHNNNSGGASGQRGQRHAAEPLTARPGPGGACSCRQKRPAGFLVLWRLPNLPAWALPGAWPHLAGPGRAAPPLLASLAASSAERPCGPASLPAARSDEGTGQGLPQSEPEADRQECQMTACPLAG